MHVQIKIDTVKDTHMHVQIKIDTVKDTHIKCMHIIYTQRWSISR